MSNSADYPTDPSPVRLGSMLYGYCEGVFGRDSHYDKRVEYIAHDWLVVREEGKPVFVSGETVNLYFKGDQHWIKKLEKFTYPDKSWIENNT